MRFAMVFCAALFMCAADARMYQWVNPNTGTVQFSGTPPSWYRASEQAGPRVLVYENGKLLDDTARPVAPERSQGLRKEAFQEVEERKQLQALRKLEQAARWRAAPTEEPVLETPATASTEEAQEAQEAQEEREEAADKTAEQLEDEMLAIYEKYLHRRASEQEEADPTSEQTPQSGDAAR